MARSISPSPEKADILIPRTVCHLALDGSALFASSPDAQDGWPDGLPQVVKMVVDFYGKSNDKRPLTTIFCIDNSVRTLGVAPDGAWQGDDKKYEWTSWP